MPQYIVQAGDTSTASLASPIEKFECDKNSLPHSRGSLAFVRDPRDGTSISQFYISLTTNENLSGKDFVFGKVVEGDNLLDQIQVGEKILSITLEK